MLAEPARLAPGVPTDARDEPQQQQPRRSRVVSGQAKPDNGGSRVQPRRARTVPAAEVNEPEIGRRAVRARRSLTAADENSRGDIPTPRRAFAGARALVDDPSAVRPPRSPASVSTAPEDPAPERSASDDSTTPTTASTARPALPLVADAAAVSAGVALVAEARAVGSVVDPAAGWDHVWLVDESDIEGSWLAARDVEAATTDGAERQDATAEIAEPDPTDPSAANAAVDAPDPEPGDPDAGDPELGADAAPSAESDTEPAHPIAATARTRRKRRRSTIRRVAAVTLAGTIGLAGMTASVGNTWYAEPEQTAVPVMPEPAPTTPAPPTPATPAPAPAPTDTDEAAVAAPRLRVAAIPAPCSIDHPVDADADADEIADLIETTWNVTLDGSRWREDAYVDITRMLAQTLDAVDCTDYIERSRAGMPDGLAFHSGSTDSWAMGDYGLSHAGKITLDLRKFQQAFDEGQQGRLVRLIIHEMAHAWSSDRHGSPDYWDDFQRIFRNQGPITAYGSTASESFADAVGYYVSRCAEDSPYRDRGAQAYYDFIRDEVFGGREFGPAPGEPMRCAPNER
ncbi:hypothetical protein CGZ91_06955 [Parenemella sanctibonifatiensis]|uniref:Uncharacterized protein n=1 Tax=Parenemella sanctibonifatiensis TaxID=2016505 RepID=A0A255EI35_9ACTN|nr:hypothetical protein CGZ91_06955 [Parenemella sanctibonifatiensis]